MQFKYLILLTLFIFLKTPLLATESLYFQSHDWLAVCDNTNTCRISGYSSDDTTLGGISVLFTLKPDTSGLPTAKVKVAFLNDENMPQSNTSNYSLEMFINKQSHGTISIDKGELVGSLSNNQTKALLASLKKKDSLKWKIKNNLWDLSTKGATTVFQKSDAFQHSFEADQSSSKLKILPTVYAQKITNEKELSVSKYYLKKLEKVLPLKKEDECFVPKGINNKLAIYALSANKRLATKLCWVGAYNTGSYFWVINKQPPFEPKLITSNGTQFYIENKIGTISSDHKSRGLGDCWSYKNFVWTGETFSVTSEGSTGLCRLIAAGGAWDLPTYTSQVTFK